MWGEQVTPRRRGVNRTSAPQAVSQSPPSILCCPLMLTDQAFHRAGFWRGVFTALRFSSPQPQLLASPAFPSRLFSLCICWAGLCAETGSNFSVALRLTRIALLLRKSISGPSRICWSCYVGPSASLKARVLSNKVLHTRRFGVPLCSWIKIAAAAVDRPASAFEFLEPPGRPPSSPLPGRTTASLDRVELVACGVLRASRSVFDMLSPRLLCWFTLRLAAPT